MFARLLVRWPRVPLNTSSRSFRTTPLVRAHDAAALLKPTLPPAAPVIHVDEPAPTARSHFSATRFADAQLSNQSKRAIRHEFMTDVQEATFELGLAGKDLLVQAKTGTGKTTAFLLPAIEQLAKKPVPRNTDVSILVLSPTRELAMQIEAEAQTLVKNHPFRVQSVIGGVSLDAQKWRLRKQRCDILVATPGRLLDLLQSTGLQEQLKSIQTIVLDEADRLLDIGFSDTLNSILEYLPDRAANPWQCMLYSATISQDVKKIASRYLTPEHKFVSTLADDEINTHEHVPQTCVTVPMSDTLKATLAVLQEDIAEHGSKSKAMVFCTTARGTAAIAKLLDNAGGGKFPPVYSIQSRMTQAGRLNVAERFKRAKSAILVTSDVTARGMDFPGVSLVVQLGLPSSADQYIHRLGRTARAGKAGKGVIIVTPHESNFLRTREMRELPIRPHHELELPTLPPSPLDRTEQEQGYTAWLGFNCALLKHTRMSRQQFIEEASSYVRDVLGWSDEETPRIPPKVAASLGLNGIRGANTSRASSSGWGERKRPDFDPNWQPREKDVSGERGNRWGRDDRREMGNRWPQRGRTDRFDRGDRGDRRQTQVAGNEFFDRLRRDDTDGRPSRWREDRGNRRADFGDRRSSPRGDGQSSDGPRWRRRDHDSDHGF